MRRNLHRPLLAKAALTLAATLACAGALFAAAPASGTELGLNVAGGIFGTPAQNAQIDGLIAQLHPAWVRVFLNWDQVEPAQGSYSAQLIDYKLFFATLPAGTKVDVDVVGSPPWANGGSSSTAAPPTNDQAFGAFMNYLTNAFGSAVTSYEIWNEEDSPYWWSGSPAQYVSLLQAAYNGVKAANPNAQVILGGLGANDYPFLQALYAAGVHGYFDAVAVHTDDACSITPPSAFAFNPGSQLINRWSFLGFTTVHDVMEGGGDGSKPVYMTEFGWSATNAPCSSGSSAGKRVGGVSAQTQADYLNQAVNCLDQPQYSYVTAAMWFDMVDWATANTPTDRYGLLTTSLQPRPAFNAFKKITTSGDPLTGGCGNFSGPKLDLISPVNGQSYRGPLQIRVKAIANGAAVAQIALKHDGKNILNFNRIDAHYRHGVLTGTIDWQGARFLAPGSHTITVVASNANGVTSTQTVTVDHLGGGAKTPNGHSQIAKHKKHRRRHHHNKRR